MLCSEILHYSKCKGPSSQSYGFSSSHVWMWELDYKKSWVLKDWCFWTVVLEKTLKSPLDCMVIQPVNPKGNQSWMFFGDWCWSWNSNTLATWCKEWLLGKDKKYWMWEEKGTTEDEMAGWHHWLDGCESEWTLGVGDGQGGLACCDSWGHKELDMTERLNWTELKNLRDTPVWTKEDLVMVAQWLAANLFLLCEGDFHIQCFVLTCASMLSHFSCVWLFVTLWTVACQEPLSMGFSR